MGHIEEGEHNITDVSPIVKPDCRRQPLLIHQQMTSNIYMLYILYTYYTHMPQKFKSNTRRTYCMHFFTFCMRFFTSLHIAHF